MNGTCELSIDCPFLESRCISGICGCSDLYSFNNVTKLCEWKKSDDNSGYYYGAIAAVSFFVLFGIGFVIYHRYIKRSF